MGSWEAPKTWRVIHDRATSNEEALGIDNGAVVLFQRTNKYRENTLAISTLKARRRDQAAYTLVS